MSETTPEPNPPSAPASLDSPRELPAVVREVRARFDAGDARGARATARTLLASPEADVAVAARAFLTETDTDPAALAATLLALGVLVLVATAYLF